MNLKEIEYIVKIAEERNVTKAAQKLFLTPSALNQQLLRIEHEIGTPLFVRSRKGFELTEAGEIYLSAAREMLRLKQETYHKLQDISQTHKGSLSIGLPPDRGAILFSYIYPEFHREYPDIKIHIYEINVRSQQEMIARGELDLGFMTLTENQKTNDEYLTLASEELLLVLPDIHPACQEAVEAASSDFPELELSLLKEEPFALIHKTSTLRTLVDSTFEQAGFLPDVLFETSRFSTMLTMAADRICCGLVPEFFYQSDRKGLSFFSLPTHPTLNQVVCYKKNSYLSKPAQYFIKLACDYFHQSCQASGKDLKTL